MNARSLKSLMPCILIAAIILLIDFCLSFMCVNVLYVTQRLAWWLLTGATGYMFINEEYTAWFMLWLNCTGKCIFILSDYYYNRRMYYIYLNKIKTGTCDMHDWAIIGAMMDENCTWLTAEEKRRLMN